MRRDPVSEPFSKDPPTTDPLDRSIDALFRRYSRYVAAIATRILGRPEDVDDVVQDVFLDAVRGAARIEDSNAIKGWLATITVRKCTRKLRARRMKGWLGFEDEPDYARVASSDASPEHRVLISKLYGVLDKLPANERVPWVLRYVDDVDLQAIADMTGTSLATIKRRLVSAHAKVKMEMGDG